MKNNRSAQATHVPFNTPAVRVIATLLLSLSCIGAGNAAEQPRDRFTPEMSITISSQGFQAVNEVKRELTEQMHNRQRQHALSDLRRLLAPGPDTMHAVAAPQDVH